jgi:hypothetical protein
MSTSIDPHNNSSNGRSLRIVSTNRLFTKVRTEQPSESGKLFFFGIIISDDLYFSITIDHRCNKFIF